MIEAHRAYRHTCFDQHCLKIVCIQFGSPYIHHGQKIVPFLLTYPSTQTKNNINPSWHPTNSKGQQHKYTNLPQKFHDIPDLTLFAEQNRHGQSTTNAQQTDNYSTAGLWDCETRVFSDIMQKYMQKWL